MAAPPRDRMCRGEQDVLGLFTAACMGRCLNTLDSGCQLLPPQGRGEEGLAWPQSIVWALSRRFAWSKVDAVVPN